MSRYIDADALKKRVEDSSKSAGLHLEDLRKIRRWINTAPSIDIEPKRGEWQEKEIFGEYNDDVHHYVSEWQSARCSVCGKYHTTPYAYYFDEYNFCPNCGADMTEREGE